MPPIAEPAVRTSAARGGGASYPAPMPTSLAPDVAQTLVAVRDRVGSVFLGKPEAIRLALIALLADGHLLLEDVPGVGKTLLGKALARSLSCTFNRIQFTPY